MTFTLSAQGGVAPFTWLDHPAGTVGFFQDKVTGRPANGFYLIPGIDRTCEHFTVWCCACVADEETCSAIRAQPCALEGGEPGSYGFRREVCVEQHTSLNQYLPCSALANTFVNSTIVLPLSRIRTQRIVSQKYLPLFLLSYTPSNAYRVNAILTSADRHDGAYIIIVQLQVSRA